MVLGPRQTGKSTAAAVRVLFEAMSHDNALILFAGASGRQSGKIMEKARQLAKSIDLAILSPPSKCEGFTLANGSQIVSLPDNEKIIRCFSAPRLIVVDEAAFASPEIHGLGTYAECLQWDNHVTKYAERTDRILLRAMARQTN